MAKPVEILEVAGREVRLTSPDKVYFPDAGYTKRDMAHYWMAVADGAVRGVRNRPMMLKRFVDGIGKRPFFQKRAPKSRPEWVETTILRFPSGRTAEEVVVNDAAGLLWVANLGCIDLNPHPIRADDLEHPDELRIDLDPMPGVKWPQVREVALLCREVLSDFGLAGWPKTSGSKGFHVLVRIARDWNFDQVRAAALALAREVERRAPGRATAKWWKEEREGVFVDYNQNAKDRTVASAYSVRARKDARVSAPLTWDEVPDVDAEDFTIATMPARFAALGDLHAGIDEGEPGSLDALLELAEKQAADGQPDAPWPPNYEKKPGEATRVAPSRAKGQRKPKFPLLIIANSPEEDAALAGLERWKARHPDVAKHLQPHDILNDQMRGRYTTWTRIRVNLQHVPEELRPTQETPDPDDDPTRKWREEWKKARDQES